MKNILITLFLLTSIFSCDNRKERVSINSGFAEWLKKNKIDSLDLSKIKGKEAFELWAYFDPINKTDSSLVWYPNKDSSYFMISNYDNISKLRLEDSNLIDIDFHQRNSDIKKQGISLVDSLKSMEMDIFWINNKTVFLAFIEKNHGTKTLMKLKIGVDSLWTNLN
ncbi:hypothetical protein [Algibacter mikhailovii]|uniref:Lipoprotein n=1 Tax=Algibacter mikhailovii TaxID=425498 RepID=A0A918QYP8_9FLAO|nr:hypothetical protein [Algibacter mikhailovii]GGZ76238.1 hypothetical protein GCM10007028_12260 [Algibacter mikhailovii]